MASLFFASAAVAQSDFERQNESFQQWLEDDRQMQEGLRQEQQDVNRFEQEDRALRQERALTAQQPQCWTMTAGQIIPNTNLRVSHSGDWCPNANGTWYLRTPR